MKNGHRKGSAFERKVAKDLSLFVSKGKDAYIFERRTAGSGGAPRDKKGLSGETGDIFSIKEEGKKFLSDLSIECKFYKNLTNNFWRFMVTDSDKVFDDFVAQAQDTHKKYFLLIVKSNFSEILCITDKKNLCKSVPFWSKNGLFLFSFKNFEKFS